MSEVDLPIREDDPTYGFVPIYTYFVDGEGIYLNLGDLRSWLEAVKQDAASEEMAQAVEALDGALLAAVVKRQDT